MNIKKIYEKNEINDLENIVRMSLSCKLLATADLLAIAIAFLENNIMLMIIFALLTILYATEDRYWDLKYHIFTKYREGGIKNERRSKIRSKSS